MYGSTWARMGGRYGWWGRHYVTECWRKWKIQRKWRDGGGIISYDREVVGGVGTSDDIMWLY